MTSTSLVHWPLVGEPVFAGKAVRGHARRKDQRMEFTRTSATSQGKSAHRLTLNPAPPQHRITTLRIQRAKIDAELYSLGWLQPHYAIERWWSEDDFNEAVAAARGGTDAYEVEVVVDLTDLREGEDVPLRFKGYDSEGMAYEADGVVLDVSDRKLGVWSVVRRT